MKSTLMAQKAPDAKIPAGMGTTTDLFFSYTLIKAPTTGHWRHG